MTLFKVEMEPVDSSYSDTRTDMSQLPPLAGVGQCAWNNDPFTTDVMRNIPSVFSDKLELVIVLIDDMNDDYT